MTLESIERGVARGVAAGIVFRGPAPESALRELESLVGTPLPPDLRAFYALHDGAEGIGVAGYDDVLSVAQMVDNWQLLRDVWSEIEQTHVRAPAAGIAPVLYSPRWVPFTQDGGGSFHCVDMQPDPRLGNVGQVIRYWNSEPPTLVAPSFAVWLETVEWTPEDA